MLLEASRLRKSFGVHEVLTDVSFRLDRRDKVALVGRNGAGKTTLLRLIRGQDTPDGGSLRLARGVKVGLLRQESSVADGSTVLEEAQRGREAVLAMESRLRELERILEGDPSADDLEEYATLHEHFVEAEGYGAREDVRSVLSHMGFDEDEFNKPTDVLSGGERTRLALARLLLEEPDLLILDEPTNHLDLQATEWLEGWIRRYPGAVLLVSHDRVFLEATAERVLDMRDGKVFAYPGPFPKFLELKQAEFERQAEVARRQKEQMDRMDEFVRRFMNSERTAQAKGRLRLLNRLRAEAVEAPKEEKGIQAGFQKTERSGDLVLRLKGISIAFDGIPLLRSVDWTVRYRERWGVIGENGAGKSTLIRIALGERAADSGEVSVGSRVSVGYFGQDVEELDLDRTAVETLIDECGLTIAQARDLLGRFLISGDDAMRPLRTLSGGEKNKVSLARLTALHPNLLVLDEPTNHLDMDSREALTNVLRDYDGTLVLVSHDRRLLGAVTDRILDVRRDGVREYPGGFADYRARLHGGVPAPLKKATPKAEPVAPTMTPRELSKAIERQERLVESLEGEVDRAESALQTLEENLASLTPEADVMEMSRRHATLQEEIAAAMAAWEEQSRELERLRDTLAALSRT